MTRKSDRVNRDEMLPEYNFQGGQRGKYAQEFAQGTNLILLAPDVVQAFPDAEAVNEALRLLIKIANQQRNSLPPQG